MTRTRHALFALVAFGLLGSGPALAQDDIPARQCQADAEKFCKEVRPGHGRLATCLGEHESELNAQCQQQMVKYREAQAQARQRAEQYAAACEGDVQSLCKDVPPGQGRIVKCLKEKEASLSATCKAAMEQREQVKEERSDAVQAAVDACAGDMQQHCKDVKVGSGRMNRCLKRNESKLSDACRAAMKAGGPVQ